MIPLFDSDSCPRTQEQLDEGAMLLRGFAAAEAPVLVDEVARIAHTAPFRHMVTPGGYTMSVAMTNCGRLGWVSDRTGYRYSSVAPDTGAPWPAMPGAFIDIAVRASAEVGFANYDPDACLINRYIAGAKLSLHQGRDEEVAWAPIVSVSLGLPAVFLGAASAVPIRCAACTSKAVTSWCGAVVRFVYHVVQPLKDGEHSLTGPARINITFRNVF